jgi:hypothetical protein
MLMIMLKMLPRITLAANVFEQRCGGAIIPFYRDSYPFHASIPSSDKFIDISIVGCQMASTLVCTVAERHELVLVSSLKLSLSIINHGFSE